MTYTQLLEAFIDYMQLKGKLSHNDFDDFITYMKNHGEAKKIVDDMMKQARL